MRRTVSLVYSLVGLSIIAFRTYYSQPLGIHMLLIRLCNCPQGSHNHFGEADQSTDNYNTSEIGEIIEGSNDQLFSESCRGLLRGENAWVRLGGKEWEDIQAKEHVKSKKNRWTKIEGQIFQYGWNIPLGLQVTGDEDREAGKNIWGQERKRVLKDLKHLRLFICWLEGGKDRERELTAELRSQGNQKMVSRQAMSRKASLRLKMDLFFLLKRQRENRCRQK